MDKKENFEKQKLNSRFFDFCRGDKIIIKRGYFTFNTEFINSFIKDAEQNNLRSLLLYTEDSEYYPCKALKWKTEPLYLFKILEAEKNSADIFFVDYLDINADIDNSLRLIQETPALCEKTILLFCKVSHLAGREDGNGNYKFFPTEQQLKDEKDFNVICKERGITAVYELYIYARFGGCYIDFINSGNRNDRIRLGVNSRNRELNVSNGL